MTIPKDILYLFLPKILESSELFKRKGTSQETELGSHPGFL